MSLPVIEASSSSDGADISFNCPAGTNLLLGIYLQGRSRVSQSMTYNSVSLTEILQELDNTGTFDSGVSIFGMLNPPTGTSYTFSTTEGGSYDQLYVVAFSGVDTDIAFTSWTTEQVSGTADQITDSIATETHELLIDALAQFRNSNPFEDTAAQTEIDSYINGGISEADGDGSSMTLEWDSNYGPANDYSYAIVAIPGITASGVEVTVPVASWEWTGYAPVITTPGPVNITIPVASWIWTGYAPVVTTEVGGFEVTIPVASWIWTGYAPLIGDGSLHIRSADAATLYGSLAVGGEACIAFCDGENWYIYKLTGLT